MFKINYIINTNTIIMKEIGKEIIYIKDYTFGDNLDLICQLFETSYDISKKYYTDNSYKYECYDQLCIYLDKYLTFTIFDNGFGIVEYD